MMKAIFFAFMSVFNVPIEIAEKAITSVESLHFDKFLVANYTTYTFDVRTAIVVSCLTDYGPGSKLLCPLLHLNKWEQKNVYITLLDDDNVYLPYVKAAVEAHVNPNNAVSFWGYQVGNHIVLQGADAFTFHSRHTHSVHRWYDFITTKLPFLKWHDDVWISFYLDMQNVARSIIPRKKGWNQGAYAEMCTPPTCTGLYFALGNKSRSYINNKVKWQFLPFYDEILARHLLKMSGAQYVI